MRERGLVRERERERERESGLNAMGPLKTVEPGSTGQTALAQSDRESF